MGRLEEALVVFSMMRAEGQGADCRPDEYTYGALLKAVAKANRLDLVPQARAAAALPAANCLLA
jgi:hypothetical protein